MATKKKTIKAANPDIVYQMLPFFDLEANINCAIEKRKTDLMMLKSERRATGVKFFLDYNGYHVELPIGRASNAFLEKLLERSKEVFDIAVRGYRPIYNHKCNQKPDYWHEIKRYVVDSDSMLADIKKALEDSRRHVVRAVIEGRLDKDTIVRTQYVIVTTYHIIPFNPWETNEQERLIDLYSDLVH